jgi:pimeloyl-ACP methyl ester carboxylesterase
LRKEEGLKEQDTAELEPRLGEIEIPVLVVWGEEDAWLDPSQADLLHQAIPDSRVKKVQGAGHFVPEDVPELVARILTDFVTTP